MKRFLIILCIAAICTSIAFALPTLAPVPGCIRAEVWPANVLWLNVISDALIALAYTAIPASLILLLRRRRDIPVDWIVTCFAAFIVLCGATHAMSVYTTWRPLYWLAGEVKAMTALVSLLTAILLQFRVLPLLMAIPSPALLREKNAALLAAVVERDAAVASEAATAASLRDQLALAERQGRTIRGLSVPVLQVAARILLMPLIGVLDSERAAQATDALLGEITRSAAAFVVLDLTGVEMVDTATAAYLLKMIAAVRLLGVETVLTGIQPGVASTMVDLGVDIASVKTYRTLGEGVRLCSKRVEES